MNNGLKKTVVALADAYCFNASTQNTGELISLVIQVEKRIDLVKTSLGEIKGFLGDMKGILKNMQEMIRRVL